MNQPLVRLDNIVKQYRQPQQTLFAPPVVVTAIDDISIAIGPGQTFGLVGESGCGKSTIGKMLLRLEAPTRGSVTFDGLDLSKLTPEQDLKLRHQIQVVLQDPYASMNPRQRVDKFVDEPQRALGRMSGSERREMVEEKLAEVGIAPGSSRLFPHEFSGGQRQRISIARALSVALERITDRGSRPRSGAAGGVAPVRKAAGVQVLHRCREDGGADKRVVDSGGVAVEHRLGKGRALADGDRRELGTAGDVAHRIDRGD